MTKRKESRKQLEDIVAMKVKDDIIKTIHKSISDALSPVLKILKKSAGSSERQILRLYQNFTDVMALSSIKKYSTLNGLAEAFFLQIVPVYNFSQMSIYIQTQTNSDDYQEKIFIGAKSPVPVFRNNYLKRYMPENGKIYKLDDMGGLKFKMMHKKGFNIGYVLEHSDNCWGYLFLGGDDSSGINHIKDTDVWHLSLMVRMLSMTGDSIRTFSVLIVDVLCKDIYNRRYIEARIGEEHKRIMRQKRVTEKKVILIMLDIDHFKKVNDTYGHTVGDFILIETSKILKKCIRSVDIIGRWGGEEFMIMLRETNMENALAIANRIKTTTANKKYIYYRSGKKIEINITLSMGLAVLNKDKEKAIRQADEMMYKSKKQGRNRINYSGGEKK